MIALPPKLKYSISVHMVKKNRHSLQKDFHALLSLYMSWKRLHTATGTSARYMIVGSTLYLWCGGTNSRQGWIDNICPAMHECIPGVYTARAGHNEANAIVAELLSQIDHNSVNYVFVIGFSRGGDVGLNAAIMLKATTKQSSVLRLIAPKRTLSRRSLKAFRRLNIAVMIDAFRGDPVPLLPPWLAQPARIQWTNKLRLPWAAHIDGMKYAAKLRHHLGKKDILL